MKRAGHTVRAVVTGLTGALFVSACATTKSPAPASQPASTPAAAPLEAKVVCEQPQACLRLADDMVDKTPKTAASVLDKCLACPSALAATYRLRASLASDLGDAEEALQVARRGVRAYPDSPELWLARGRFAISVNQKAEAMTSLRRARELAPDDLAVAEAYQRALTQHGSEMERGQIAIEPLLDEAEGRMERGDLGGATTALNDALTKVAKVPSLRALVRHRLALVALSSGSARQAATILEVAIEEEMDPTPLRAEILLAYAEALLRLDRTDEAVTAATAAIAIAPADPLAYVNLALAQARRKNMKAALAAWRQAFEHGLAKRVTADQVRAMSGEIRNERAFVELIEAAYKSSTPN